MKDLEKLVRNWIRADYLCKRPQLVPMHLQGQIVLNMIDAEEKLREAITGESDLLAASKVLGLKQVGDDRPKKRRKKKKHRKKSIKRETLDDPESRKPLKGKGFFS